MGITERKQRERETEEIFSTIMIENFSRINVRHQIKYPGSSENTEQDKYKNKQTTKLHLGISESNCRKSIIRKKILKAVRGKNTLQTEKQI